MKTLLRSVLAGLLIGLAAGAQAAPLSIEITRGVEGALPVAIVPFDEGGRAAPEDVAQIIADDLARSGRFSPLPRQDMIAQPHQAAQINFADWRVLGMEGLVIGQVRPAGADRYSVQFQLFNVFKGDRLVGFNINTTRQDLRRTAHQISDIIYEKLTGQPGAFDTRIAYVTTSGPTSFSLQVADSDGHNPQTILTSKQPILSPAWSPDGTRLAYLSFENRRPQIFIQDLASGSRERIASYPGLNGAPAWSPDGRRLALTLSKDGNPEIYVLNLASKALQRLTDNGAIDTEPSWSPDGNTLLFTSDRGGKPQIYKMSAGGGEARRVTFNGDYNARGVFSPDGTMLAMVHREGGNYRIAVQDLSSGEVKVLSERSLDESPSFAPNGSMVIYATGDQGVLAAVSVDGRVRQRLALQEGNVREAVWSPFGRKTDFEFLQP